jgi:hypothetical protein
MVTALRRHAWCLTQNDGWRLIMPISRKETRGGRAFAFPLFGIVILLASYWVLADWQDVPAIISGALASMHWPN